jgi:hypothetical protein
MVIRSPATLTKRSRLVKLSILAWFHQLALPGMQKQVIVWLGVFVFVFTMFTVLVSIATKLSLTY